MSKDRLLNDEELLIEIGKATSSRKSRLWQDASFNQEMLDLINTQKRLYAESELSKLVNTTNYDDVPYFTGIAAEMIDQRIIALNTKHDWKDNDTWSVFKCNNCGMTVFAPHELPEYGCHKELRAEQRARIK